MDGKASEHAHQAIELASDKQAIDIILLDIRKSNTFADFFVLLTVDNSRHMSAIAEDLGKELTAHGARLHHQEGSADSGWILLDFGATIIHIFAPAERTFYQLENIWAQAIPMVTIQ